MNRFFLFALCLILVSSCRGHFINDSNSPEKPCVFQLDLPDTVGSWHIDTFSLPKKVNFYNQNLFFINEKVGYLMKSAFTFFKTLDGGKNWEQIYDNPNSGSVGELYFINENVGFVSVFGRPNASLITTTDGGKTWKYRIYDIQGTISNIHFTDNSNGLALLSSWENNNFILSLIQTHNQGMTWEKIVMKDALSNNNLILQVLDEKKVFTVGRNNNQNHLLKSIDGGLTWQKRGDLPNFIGQIKFIDEQNGFLVDFHKCFTTADGGLTWQEKTGIDGSPELLFMDNTQDILLSLQTIQCHHGDYADSQSEFLSLDNNAIIGSKKVTNFYINTSFFVNNKLGFVVSRDKLLRFTR